MKHQSIAAFAGLCGVLIASSEAQATYIGIGLQLHTTVTINDVARDVYRVYAVCDGPEAWVCALGGSVANGQATIKNLNAAGGGPGGGFVNVGEGSTPPKMQFGKFISGDPNAPWGTFATIGVAVDDIDYSGDDVNLSPGFPSFINGTQWGPASAAWFHPGPMNTGKAENGLSGTFFNGEESLSGLGVLIAQLTVTSGEHVAGTMFVNVVYPGALASSGTYTGQTFSSIPGPGALGMFGIAGLVGARRRRRTDPRIS